MAEPRTPAVAETRGMDQIHPYPKNPRKISRTAVDAVKESIEKYGYRQPIVVDPDGVIVVGHTRYQALMELGYEEVTVYVTDIPAERAHEYRLVDNRTSEMTSWDNDALVYELREFEGDLAERMFPDLSLEVDQLEDAEVGQDELDRAMEKVLTPKERAEIGTTIATCPACSSTFDVRTDSLPGGDHIEVMRDEPTS